VGGASFFGASALLIVCCTSTRASAQACCAGGTVITPGRLSMHEDALVGLQEKAASVLGTYDLGSRYLPQLAGDTELDFEQDLFAAVRVLQKGQVALLVPLVETRRATPTRPGSVGGAHLGGGIGDVNLSGRYDFVAAGQSQWLPGIAVLAGLTVPSGAPPEIANPVNATGVGAFQLNAALALEQVWGSWLVNATCIVAQRTEHGGETLGTAFTLLAAGAYTFDNDAALGLSASYAFEGDATSGLDVPDSAKHVTTVTLSGLWPLSDTWRLLGGIYVSPPLGGFGDNEPAAAGLSYTIVRSWS
jgi:hypothetical protein